MHSVTLDSSKIRKTILNLVVSLYLLAFALYYINPAEIRKVYYLAGYLTVLSALLSIRTTKTWTQNWDLAGALALFALGLFAWYGLNYAHGEYWDIYDSYKDTAKVLAMSAIVVFLLSSLRFTFNATWFNYLLIAAGLVTNLYAIYQG
jgi:O-antigen ligase